MYRSLYIYKMYARNLWFCHWNCLGDTFYRKWQKKLCICLKFFIHIARVYTIYI